MLSMRIRDFWVGIALMSAPVFAQSGSLTLANPLTDTATDEDVPLVVRVRDVFTDPESLVVAYTAKVETGTGSVKIEGDNLVYTPMADWSGTTQVTVFGEAGGRGNFTRFLVEVHAVNDPPFFTDGFGSQSFANSDSLRLDFTGKVKDKESQDYLSLRADSIPGCDIRINGLLVTLTAPGRIEPGRLRLRVVDPQGGVSPYLEIDFNPNAAVPGDTLTLSRGAAAPLAARCQAFGDPNTGMSVVTADLDGLRLDTYRADGSKARPTRAAKYPGIKPTQLPRIFRIGGNFVAEIFHYPSGGGDTRNALCMFDADLNVVNAFEPPVSQTLWIMAADTANRRIFVRHTIFPSSGPGKITIEAFDTALQPLPALPFADSYDEGKRTDFVFDEGRMLLVSAEQRGNPIEMKVETYSPELKRIDSTRVILDHQPRNDSLTPELQSVLLLPYAKGWCLFAGIQDFTLFPDGSSQFMQADYATIKQKFGPDFRTSERSQPWDRSPSDRIYPLEAFPLYDGALLGSVVQQLGINRDLRVYRHRFDESMDPMGPIESDVYSQDSLKGPPALVKLSDRKYAEIFEYVDGHSIAVMHRIAADPAPALPRSLIRPAATGRKLVLRGQGRQGFDALGKRAQGRKP